MSQCVTLTRVPPLKGENGKVKTLTEDRRKQQETAAGEAFREHMEIVSLRNEMQQSFFEMGKRLHFFFVRERFKALGYSSFDQYVADPAVDIGARMAYMYKDVFKFYVLDLQRLQADLVPIGVSKLEMLRAPIMETGEVDYWLEQGASLSRSDLQRLIRSEMPGTFDVNEEGAIGWRPFLTFREPATFQLKHTLRAIVDELIRVRPAAVSTPQVKAALRVLELETEPEGVIRSWIDGDIDTAVASDLLGVEVEVAEFMREQMERVIL